MKNFPLSRQILVAAAIAVAVMVAVLSSVVTNLAREAAIKQTEQSLQEQTALIVTTLEFAQETLKLRALDNLRVFERSLDGHIRASGRSIATGKEQLPELLLGNTPINGNTASYIIFRMCDKSGDLSTDSTINCVRPMNANAGGSPVKGDLNYSESARFGSAASPYYRIVVRVQGARNTVSHTETIVHF